MECISFDLSSSTSHPGQANIHFTLQSSANPVSSISTIVIFSYFSFVGLFTMNGFFVIFPGLHCEGWRKPNITILNYTFTQQT